MKGEAKSMRLNRFLSDAGVCSRREADRFIEAGRVMINGEAAGLGSRVGDGDVVAVDGKKVRNNSEKIVIAYNKPIGVECTSDRSNKDNIIDAIAFPERIYTIGRLDKNSCGLILLTNDGDLAYVVSKAGEKHEKEYHVVVDRPIDADFIRKMENGVEILGKRTAPSRVYQKSENSFNIVLIQGMNRQIRRMCEECGAKVRFLKRIRVMNIRLGELRTGEWRKLSAREIRSLYENA